MYNKNKGEPNGSPLVLRIKTSCFDSFLLAGQNDRVQFLACGPVSVSFAVTTEAEEVAADHILNVLMGYCFPRGVIDQFSQRFVHRLMRMAANEDIDALEAISGSVVHIVLCLVLHTEYIVDLPGTAVERSNADIYESSFASVPIFDAQSQCNIIQREIVCIFTCSVVLVVAVHNADNLIFVRPQMLDPPALLLRRTKCLSIHIRFRGSRCVFALVSGKYYVCVGAFQKLLESGPLALVKLGRSGVDVRCKKNLSRC